MTFNLTDQALHVNRIQTRNYKAIATGLFPNTIYTITIDGVDWSEGTKQEGKDFGASLVSDAEGSLSFEFLMEIPLLRNANFELPRTNTLQFQNEQVASISRRTTSTATNIISVDLTDTTGQSKAQILINRTLLLRTGPRSMMFPIE